MRKLLIALQYHPGDQATANIVARMIADLEPEKSKYADFMFVTRWDGKHDRATIEHVARKFDQVRLFTTSRQSKGWPAAPNDVALETYGHFAQRVRLKLWDYAAIQLIEPDCVPLARDWIKQLHAEWHESDQLCMGFIGHKSTHPIEHINGNCMISPAFQKKCRGFYSAPPVDGWDVYHAPTMVEYSRASRLIWNDYARQSITCDELFAAKRYPDGHPLGGQDIWPALHHGVKGFDAIICVKKKFGLP
jgi:hypothetical protein